MGGIIIENLNIFGTPAIRTPYVCPIGGEKFVDFHIPQCPGNKFVMFKEKFTNAELKNTKKLLMEKIIVKFPKRRENIII